MLVTLTPGSPEPIYDQIAASLRRSIAEGRLNQGDVLPPARVLAASIKVNVHTVLRAYASLRDEGMVDLRPGRGATVIADTNTPDARVRVAVTALVAEARKAGVPDDALFEMLREQLRG